MTTITADIQGPIASLLYVNAHLERGELHDVATGRAGVFSARSPDGTHASNEDSVAVFRSSADSGILALADGMGGARAGEMASSVAMTKLKQAIENGIATGKTLRACILDGFEDANHALIDTGLGAATTLAVVEIQGHTIRPYHAGDSMVLVVGQRGRLKLQTVAHSPVGYAVESGVLGEREAMDHERRHVVSNVVGSADMHIEVGPLVTLARHDTLVVASDGLTDNLHTREIVGLVRKGPLDSVIDATVRWSHKRMTNPTPNQPSKPDDLSFIVYRRSS